MVLAGLVAVASPSIARAPAGAETRLAPGAEADVEAFYADRRAPLWLDRNGPKPAAEALVALLARADEDGLDPARYDLDRLRDALRDRRRTAAATLRADRLFSTAFARWVRDLHQPADVLAVHYADPELAPQGQSVAQILAAAASAPSLDAHLEEMRRMNPFYEAVRRAMATAPAGRARETLRANLARLRALPRDPGPRFVLVDTASARLWMYEGGRPVGSMKVVVGKRGMSTPLMAGLIKYVALRPYWNVPPDLVRDKYAPRFVGGGWRTVVQQRFEVLSDFSEAPRTLNPRDVDWSAVAAGRTEVRVRQLPGGQNFMGAMKFMFPNRLGVYLHDTPERWAFQKSDRRISSGCVRLEDAPRLLAWAFAGKPPALPRANREKDVGLPTPVPVYITYLTALPDAGGRITYQADIDGRDAPLLAALDPVSVRPASPPRRGGSASGSDR